MLVINFIPNFSVEFKIHPPPATRPPRFPVFGSVVPVLLLLFSLTFYHNNNNNNNKERKKERENTPILPRHLSRIPKNTEKNKCLVIYIPMNTDDLPEQNTNEVPPQPDHKGQKMNKNGKPRKALSEEDAKRRAEILRLGREKALAKKKALKENPPTPPVTKTIPEPPTPVPEKDVESEPETLKVVSIPKKKKKNKKKIVIMDESSSSSSEEEVIVRKRKPKKKPTPPPKPPTAAPAPAMIEQPKPSIPEPSQEEIDRMRKEKIRRMKEREKKDKMMSSIFN